MISFGVSFGPKPRITPETERLNVVATFIPTKGMVSSRQLEIFALRICGFGIAEIATRLRISDSTVKNHLQNIRKRVEDWYFKNTQKWLPFSSLDLFYVLEILHSMGAVTFKDRGLEFEARERNLNTLLALVGRKGYVLTPREIEVAEEVFLNNRSFQEAATRLNISLKTLKNHVRSIYRKIRDAFKIPREYKVNKEFVKFYCYFGFFPMFAEVRRQENTVVIVKTLRR